ncbi:MAG: hypothetical protein ACOVQA_10370, partial [Thermoflexibacteraceae bacterium]
MFKPNLFGMPEAPTLNNSEKIFTPSTEVPFLKHFAEQLLENHLDELADIQIILPTRRACLYTKYYLA